MIYSFVDDKGFKELHVMQQLEPRYEIPHRTTFSRSIIPSIYEVKQQVKSKADLIQQEKSKIDLIQQEKGKIARILS